MTRLSDSLRGLADRAPVDEVGVSTSSTTRRIYRGRRLRSAANATAGVGVAAVIAFAAINPGMSAGDSSVASAAKVGAAEDSAGGDSSIMAPGFDISGAGESAWGQCGTQPFNGDAPAVTDAWSLALGEIDGEVEQGSAVTAALTATSTPAATAAGYNTTGPNFMVLWNGIVVGAAQNPVIDQGPQDVSDNEAILDSRIDMVNCWDGTPLPGGAYELVAYQDFFAPESQPVEPTLVPVDPAPSPDAQIAPVEHAVSNTVAFTVAGEVPEDPFGAYLSPAAPAIVYPDDFLTPSLARDEYAARVTTGAWNMAAGTQRVVKTGDSATEVNENAWLDNYYGCSGDGATTPGFPAASADWPLLNVEAALPGSVGVSYGWVVDDNPEVKVSVSNASGYTLPGFWGEPSASIYLVKDGKVVATSYLSSTNPNGYPTSTPASADGLLAPDASLSGTYLWRDVSGCWIGSTQDPIKPGKYTVLIVQDLYLDNGSGGYGGPIVYFDDMRSVGGDAAGASADTSTMIAPPPVDGNYDWLSLQVWTSLGQVTIK